MISCRVARATPADVEERLCLILLRGLLERGVDDAKVVEMLATAAKTLGNIAGHDLRRLLITQVLISPLFDLAEVE